MSQNSKNTPDRQLAVILFADIQGYTALMQKDEMSASQMLRKFRQTVEREVPAHRGRVIHFYGDGALCIYSNPIEAIDCAMSMQQIFAISPAIPVRMGIHSGTIVHEEGRIYGDSVNVASRIESMAVPGSVLLSDKVRKEIRNLPDYRVVSLGEYAFKNVEELIEVFAVAAGGLVIPDKKKITGKFKPKSFRKSIFATAGLFLTLLVVAGYFLFQNGEVLKKAVSEIPINSIAVLPFEDRSTGVEQDFLAAGVHDDLLTYLGKIGGLKVISRSSVLRFKDSRPDLSEIGSLLGVANILEGSVTRRENQVHINVQLVKAATSETLWSEMYDREVTATNLFSIQTEIARQIANVLKMAISPEQKVLLEQQPTTHTEAYESYLRANQLIELRNNLSLLEAKDLLEKAIALDGEFALAYIQLGTVYALLVDYGKQDPEENFKLAWDNLNKALELDPLKVEAYALRGFLYYIAEGNEEKAVEDFERAIAMNPNYGATYLWYANCTLELGGNMAKAREILQNAMIINPLSPVLINRVGLYSAEQGNLSEAIANYKKGIRVEPAFPNFWRNLCALYSKNLGMLDSAAVYGHQSTVMNERRGRYLENLLIGLEDLEMLEETQNTLSSSVLVNWEDSLINALQSIDLAFYKEDFENASRKSEELVNTMGFNYKIARFEALFFQRKYKECLALYQRLYPSSDGGEHLTPYAMADLKCFQTYVYCLRQTGQDKLANELWDRYGPMVMSAPEGQDEYYVETMAREVFAVRQLATEGRLDEAVTKLKQYFDGGFLSRWKFFKMDPMLDPVRDLDSYKTLFRRIENKVSVQRASFESYLERWYESVQ